MKKIGILLTAFLLACSVSACKTIDSKPVSSAETSSAAFSQTTSSQVSSNTSSSSPASSQDTSSNQTPTSSTAGVVINGDEVTVTVPKNLLADGDNGALTDDQVNSGFLSSKLNDDGSVSYTMSKASYDAYVKSLKDENTAYLNEIKGSGDYASVTDVLYSKDLTDVTLVVDKNAYQNGTDKYVAKGVALKLATYQLYAGVPYDELKVVVYVENSETNEVLETYVYPDSLG